MFVTPYVQSHNAQVHAERTKVMFDVCIVTIESQFKQFSLRCINIFKFTYALVKFNIF
jgi:hypothetical protein